MTSEETAVKIVVEVEFTFVGPDGSTLIAVTPGEASDAGDKATSKAMSVAERTALLIAFLLPTNEPDWDKHGQDPKNLPAMIAEVKA